MSGWLALEEKCVLVVGAGAFGAEVALGFLEQGARVAVADFSRAKLASLTSATGNGHLDTLVVDVRSPEACREMIDNSQRVLGGLDVVVHAVGVNVRRPVEETTDEDWRDIIDTNLASTFWISRSAIECMTNLRKGGSVILISSVSSVLAHPDHGAYAASKAGMNQLARVMAVENASRQIRVNVVAPGYADTPLTEKHISDPDTAAELIERVPMKRLATAADIVGPVLFLASGHAAYITGAVLIVDGGRTLD